MESESLDFETLIKIATQTANNFLADVNWDSFVTALEVTLGREDALVVVRLLKQAKVVIPGTTPEVTGKVPVVPPMGPEELENIFRLPSTEEGDTGQ